MMRVLRGEGVALVPDRVSDDRRARRRRRRSKCSRATVRTRRSRSATRMMSGTVVTDEPTPQPVRRAQITLSNTETGFVKIASTDDAGRFTVPDLPAGRYSLSATKAGLRAHRLRRQAVRSAGHADHARRSPADDRPHPENAARRGDRRHRSPTRTARRRSARRCACCSTASCNGERTLVAGGDRESHGRDDGRPRHVSDLRAARRRVHRLGDAAQRGHDGDPGDDRSGDSRGDDGAAAAGQRPDAVRRRAPSPAAPPPPQPRDEYQTVGYTADLLSRRDDTRRRRDRDARPGEERSGVDFAVQLVRTAKIEGSVVVPPGVAPQTVQLTMTPAGHQGSRPSASAASTFVNRVTPGPDGKFTLHGVPPGQYTLNARANRPTGGAGAAGVSRQSQANAMQFTFRVAAGGGGAGAINPDEIMAQMRGGRQRPRLLGLGRHHRGRHTRSRTSSSRCSRAMTLSGSVEFKTTRGTPVPELLARARLRSRLRRPAACGVIMSCGGVPTAQMDPTGKFTVTGVTPGPLSADGHRAGGARARGRASRGRCSRRGQGPRRPRLPARHRAGRGDWRRGR